MERIKIMDLQKSIQVRLMKIGILLFLIVILSCIPIASGAGICEANDGHSCWYVATNGSDSNNGSFENPFATIQCAMDNMSSGDIIYLRGGTYNQGSILILEEKDGTATNWSVMKSYPGEWAIVDGDNVTTSPKYAVILGNVGDNSGRHGANPTQYWKFENFEVKNGGHSGFWFEGGPMQFRYMYIHDNQAPDGNADLPTGITLGAGRDNIIEYCWFKNNGASEVYQANGANVEIIADYRDDSNQAPNMSKVPKGNIFRYNLFENTDSTQGAQSIKYKSQQRFHSEVGDAGDPIPDPPPSLPYNSESDVFNFSSDWFTTYKTWGDLWHHNIVLGGEIMMQQDFGQVYNNICNRSISLGMYEQMPILYHMMAYNNNMINLGGRSGIITASGIGNSGTASWIYPYFHVYNNIVNGTNAAWNIYPFNVCRSSEDGGLYGGVNYTNFIIDHNLINDADNSQTFIIGHLYTSPYNEGDFYYKKTAAEFNAVSTKYNYLEEQIVNWDINGNLFNGYIPNASFVLNESESLNVSNGGIGGAHPYLNVTLPSYVGAVNPNDSDWVDGVLGLADVDFLENGTDDPSWIEGYEEEGEQESYSFNQSMYNTGWQTVFINSTQNMTSIRNMMNSSNVLWIVRWNSTSQKFESYKSGWSYRNIINATEGDAVFIRVINNNTVTRNNATGPYNWTLSQNWNLVGLEYNGSKTLSQINSSINNEGCDVDLIFYIKPDTMVEYSYVCGYSANESIEVSQGQGFWMNATINIDKLRVW